MSAAAVVGVRVVLAVEVEARLLLSIYLPVGRRIGAELSAV